MKKTKKPYSSVVPRRAFMRAALEIVEHLESCDHLKPRERAWHIAMLAESAFTKGLISEMDAAARRNRR